MAHILKKRHVLILGLLSAQMGAAQVCDLIVSHPKLVAYGTNPAAEAKLRTHTLQSSIKHYWIDSDKKLTAVLSEIRADVNPYMGRDTLDRWMSQALDKVRSQVIPNSTLLSADARVKIDQSSRREIDMTYSETYPNGTIKIAERQTTLYVNPSCQALLYVTSYSMDMNQVTAVTEEIRTSLETTNPGKFWIVPNEAKTGVVSHTSSHSVTLPSTWKRNIFLILGALVVFVVWRRRVNEDA